MQPVLALAIIIVDLQEKTQDTLSKQQQHLSKVFC